VTQREHLSTVGDPPGPAGVASGPEYRDLPAWVEEWFVPTIRRSMRSSMKWCERWWAHPEAAARLGAMWAAWEVANADGGSAMSQWWLSHFEPHWNILIDAHGPFSGCGEGRCRHARRLPVAACPPEVRYFDQ
jgi:hypothetical protein